MGGIVENPSYGQVCSSRISAVVARAERCEQPDLRLVLYILLYGEVNRARL